MSKKKITVKEKEFCLPSGNWVKATFGNSYVAYIMNHQDDHMKVDGLDIRTVHWNDYFEGGRLTPMMYNYKPAGCRSYPFVKNSDKDSPFKIGMYLGVNDMYADAEVAEHTSTGRILYRKSIGELMVLMYVITEKSILIDRRGHKYKVNVQNGVGNVFEYFKERIEMEGAESMKQQICHVGGMLSGAISVAATSPRKVLEFIDQITMSAL